MTMFGKIEPVGGALSAHTWRWWS